MQDDLTIHGRADKSLTPSQHIDLDQDQTIAKFGHDFSVGQNGVNDTTKKIIPPTKDVLQKQSFTASKELEEDQVSFPLSEEIQIEAENVEECVENFFEDFSYEEEERLEAQGTEKIEIGRQKEISASNEIETLFFDNIISMIAQLKFHYESSEDLKQIVNEKVTQKAAEPNKINEKGQVAFTSEDVGILTRDIIDRATYVNILYKLLLDGTHAPLTEPEIEELHEALTASLIEKLESRGFLLLQPTYSEKSEKSDKQHTAEVSKLNNLPIQSLDRAQRKSIDQDFKTTAILVSAQTRSLISDIGMINRRNAERAKEEKEAARAEEHYWIIKKDIMQTEERREQRIESYKKFDILANEVSKKVIQTVNVKHSVNTSLRGTNTATAAA